MPDKSLSNTLNDTAKEYEKLLNTDNGVSQILENADKKAERNFRSDIKKAEQTAKDIAKKAKSEYSAYSGKTNTQTADSIALNAYQKRLYEVENDLQNNIDKSLLAYQALKANGQLSAAELEKENIQNLVQLKKNATDSIIRNAKTVYEAKDSERALAYKKERDAIEDKRRQEQINEIINEYMRNPETIDLQKRYMAEKKMYENDASKAWYKVVPVSQSDINSLYSEATEEDMEKVNSYYNRPVQWGPFNNPFPETNFKTDPYNIDTKYIKTNTTWTDVERAMADGSLERWEKIVIYENYLRHEERVINTISEKIKDDYSGIKDGTIDLAYLASTLGFHNEEENKTIAESLLQAAKIQKLNNEVSEIKSEDEYSPDDLKTKINNVYKGYTEEEKEELFKTYEFKIKSKINFNLKENPEIQDFWKKYETGSGKKPSEDEQLDVIAQSVMYLSYAAEVIEKITAQQQGNGEWMSEGDLTEFYNQVDSSRIQYLDYFIALHIIRLVYEDQLKQSGLSEEEKAYIEQQIKYIDNLNKSIKDYYKFMMSAENIYNNFGTYEEYKAYINSPEYKLSTLTDEELQNLDTYNTTGKAPVMSPEERKARELSGLPVPMTEDELKAFISSLGIDSDKIDELISQEQWQRATVGEYQKLDDSKNPDKEFVYELIGMYSMIEIYNEDNILWSFKAIFEGLSDREDEKLFSFIYKYLYELYEKGIIYDVTNTRGLDLDRDITFENNGRIYKFYIQKGTVLSELYKALYGSYYTGDINDLNDEEKFKEIHNILSGALYLYDNEKQLELQEDAKNFATSMWFIPETAAAGSSVFSFLDLPNIVSDKLFPRYTEVSGYRPAYAMAAPITLWRTSVVNGRAETIEDEGWRNAYLIGNSVLQMVAMLAAALATGGAAGAAAGGSSAAASGAASAVASSVSKGAALFLMTSNAGTSAYVDAALRGASSDQAFTYGVVVAGINLILEKLPIDDLFNIINSASKTTVQQGVKGILSKTFRILGHAGLKATEEALTTISETIADDIINGAFSESSQLVQQLVASGYTLEEAKKQAFMSKLADVVMSAIGGGISGLVSSVGSTVKGSRSETSVSSDMKMIMDSDLNSLLENFIKNKPSTNTEIDMLINSSPELQTAFFNVIQNDLGIDVIFSDTDIIANTDNLLTLFKDPAKYKAQFSLQFKKSDFQGQQKTDVQTGSNPYAQDLQVNTDTVSNPYGRYMREVDTSAGNAYSRMLPQNGSPDTGTALYIMPEAGSGSALSPLYPGEITGNGVTPAGGGIRVSDRNIKASTDAAPDPYGYIPKADTSAGGQSRLMLPQNGSPDTGTALYIMPEADSGPALSPLYPGEITGNGVTPAGGGIRVSDRNIKASTDAAPDSYGYMPEAGTSAGNAYSRMLPQNGSPDTGTALYTLPEADSGPALSPLYPGEITGNGVTPAGGGIRVSDDNTGVNKNTRAGRNIAYDYPEELLSKIGRELQGTPTTEKINGKSLVYNKVDITPESGPVYELSIAISDYARSKGRNVVFYSGDVVYDNNIIEASGFETGDGILYVNISKPGSVYWYFGYEYGRDVLRSPDTDEATAFRDSVSGLVYGDDKKKFELDIEIDLSVNGDIRKELSEEEKRSVAENEVFADKFRIYLIRLLEDVNLEKLAAKAPGLLLRLSESLDSYITYLSGKIKNAEDPFYSEMREFINIAMSLSRKIRALLRSSRSLRR